MTNSKAPGQHESLEVDQNSNRNRMKLIRQFRKDMTHLKCHLEIGRKLFRVNNLSAFGLLLYTDAENSTPMIEGNLIVNDMELGLVRLRVVRSQKIEEGQFTWACEVQGDPISLDCVQSIEDVQKITQEIEKRRNLESRVPHLFARKIYEIRDWLENLQNQINHYESNANKNDTHGYRDYESTFVQVMGAYFNSIMPIKNTDLRQLLGDQDPETTEICYEFMRDKLKNLIYQAPFSNRVYNKPLGYAGDYEMMNIIYQNDALGTSLFAKCLHDYWVKQPAAQAVRNRAVYIRQKIESLIQSRSEENLEFLSVACGPAMEWQNLLLESPLRERSLKVTLLDQDEQALVHAQRKMKEISLSKTHSIQFRYEHKAIKNILARGLTEKYDMIYSAGLFDYFSDPVAQLAAQKLYDALKPKGQLIIGNFDVSNPNSIIMDSALDWRLLYRSADNLKNLFSNLGGQVTVEQEKLNINIFCVIEKN